MEKYIDFLLTSLAMAVNYLFANFRYKLFGNRSPLSEDEELDVEGEVVVVTGANRGLGKQTALEFAKRGAIVVMGCRNVKTGQEAANEIRRQTKNENLAVIPLDLMDMNSVERFASTISSQYPKVKILVNNAGAAGADTNDPKKLTKDGMNPVMASNHFGHFLLTNLLLEQLRKATDPRVIVLSSTFQQYSKLDVNDLTMEKSGFGILNELPYANSKHANSLFASELGKRLKAEGSNINVYSVCPGLVLTNMYDQTTPLAHFLLSLDIKIVGLKCHQAVSEYVMHVSLSNQLDDSESGQMFRFREPCREINDKLNKESDMAAKLWNLSASLVNLNRRLKLKSV